MRNEETLRTLALQVRNWGKWGPDDEVGTPNYITPQTIAPASRLVTAGKVFALGIPLQRHGPQSGTRQRFNPIHARQRKHLARHSYRSAWIGSSRAALRAG